MKFACILIGIIFLSVLGGVISEKLRSQSDEPRTPYVHIVIKNDLKIVCLNGVEYWMANRVHEGYLAPKLNTDGSIGKCDGNLM